MRPVKSRRKEGCFGVLTDTTKDSDVKSCWLVPPRVKTVHGNSLDTWLLKRALEPGSGDFSGLLALAIFRLSPGVGKKVVWETGWVIISILISHI